MPTIRLRRPGATTALACFIALLCLVHHAPAQDAQADRRAERLQRYLQQHPDADANADGALTVQEARAHMRATGQDDRPGARGAARQPKPTHADFAYGEHARQRLDVWLPENADGPVPVLVYFHGGGFVKGNKSFNPLQAQALARGIACVSANYRFVDGETTYFPTPLQDGARVVQTIRQHAADWGIDPDRIVLTGGSAGANISIWLALHPDMADPESTDPVARQSTRISGVIGSGGQTTNDPRTILKEIGGNPQIHPTFRLSYPGADQLEKMDQIDDPAMIAVIEESSAINFVSADDPPLLLRYGQAPPTGLYPPDARIGDSIHSAKFGLLLQPLMAAHGIPCHVHYPGSRGDAPEPMDFLLQIVGMD